MICLVAVLVLLIGHFAVDASATGSSPADGLHLHGGFTLPNVVPLGTLMLWTIYVVRGYTNLAGWVDPPTTPPPLLTY